MVKTMEPAIIKENLEYIIDTQVTINNLEKDTKISRDKIYKVLSGQSIKLNEKQENNLISLMARCYLKREKGIEL